MQLNVEPKPVLAVCLNAAWQKTLNFPTVDWNGVNRAVDAHEAGGGKGVNVARVFRNMNWPVALATFLGGFTGQCLRKELDDSGVNTLAVETNGVTRCCYTVIDRNHATAAELIEPSATIQPEELERLMNLLQQNISRFSAVAVCGSLPPGVTTAAYELIAQLAHKHGIPVILDAVNDVARVLNAGVHMLKINAAELARIVDAGTPMDNARELLRKYPALQWLAITDGPDAAFLLRQHGEAWSLAVPKLHNVISPIGAGDCATAIITRRIAENRDPVLMPEAFADALACASASCLTDTPSFFKPADVAVIRQYITIKKIQSS